MKVFFFTNLRQWLSFFMISTQPKVEPFAWRSISCNLISIKEDFFRRWTASRNARWHDRGQCSSVWGVFRNKFLFNSIMMSDCVQHDTTTKVLRSCVFLLPYPSCIVYAFWFVVFFNLLLLPSFSSKIFGECFSGFSSRFWLFSKVHCYATEAI